MKHVAWKESHEMQPANPSEPMGSGTEEEWEGRHGGRIQKDLGIQSIQRQPQSGTWDGEAGRQALSWDKAATKGPGHRRADGKA